MILQKSQNTVFSFLTITLTCVSLLLSFSVKADDYTSPPTIKGSKLVNAEELIGLADTNEKLIIIDARIRSDRQQGYIPSSISLPDTYTDCETLASILPSLESDVAFYCNGPKCRRSDRAVVIAAKCGYNNIYWFRGGFKEWLAKHYSITK